MVLGKWNVLQKEISQMQFQLVAKFRATILRQLFFHTSQVCSTCFVKEKFVLILTAKSSLQRLSLRVSKFSQKRIFRFLCKSTENIWITE